MSSTASTQSELEKSSPLQTSRLGPCEAGDSATLKLEAFSFVEHGTVAGTVRWLSEGAFSQDDNGSPVEPYYKARIALGDLTLHGVPDSFRLVPGMTLTADINVGSRSVAMYMLRGVIRGVHEAMREP